MTWRIWAIMIPLCAILIAPWLYEILSRPDAAPPAYPAMCFISGSTDLTGYAPATWIERDGIKNLAQKFALWECLDGKQFVTPWIKQGGVDVKDTH